MKLSHEEKRTPTFRQWASEANVVSGDRFPIVRVFCNSEWRTVTFVTMEFKLNFKYTTDKDFQRTEREVRKVLLKHCRAYIEVQSVTKCEVELLPASDADESPQLFEPDNLGYVSK